MEVLYPLVREKPYYDDDIYFMSVNSHLQSLVNMPENGEEKIQVILKYIITNFEINKDDHYLIYPLQGCGLKEDICFAEFSFLTEKEESIMITQIATVTGIQESDVANALEHTKKSRSPDFLKGNLIVIRIENQTSYVNRRAYRVAQHIIYYLYLIHIAFGMESSIVRIMRGRVEDNYHVAILSQDSWRRGHGYDWNAHLQCNIDLDFLKEDQYQKLFCKLYTTFESGVNLDELADKFFNALVLFNRGIYQRYYKKDDSLALLLYVTAAESLLTESFNEKRLRLCAILSRITSSNGTSQSEMAHMLDNIYMKRNNFVHAGESPFFDYNDKHLAVLEQAIAQLILKYFEVDSLITLQPGETRISAWNKYVDMLFKNIIYTD